MFAEAARPTAKQMAQHVAALRGQLAASAHRPPVATAIELLTELDAGMLQHALQWPDAAKQHLRKMRDDLIKPCSNLGHPRYGAWAATRVLDVVSRGHVALTAGKLLVSSLPDGNRGGCKAGGEVAPRAAGEAAPRAAGRGKPAQNGRETAPARLPPLPPLILGTNQLPSLCPSAIQNEGLDIALLGLAGLGARHASMVEHSPVGVGLADDEPPGGLARGVAGFGTVQ